MGMILYLNIVLSAIGFAYFTYGRKSSNFHFLIFGIVIMGYSYFIKDAITALIIGAVLMIAPFFTQRFSKF